MDRKISVLMVALMVLLASGAFATGSLSLSLNSLDAITVGGTTTLTATVSASGDSVSNAQVAVTLPTGLTTSDSTTQSIGTLSSGQSSSKSWSITGNSASTYTITVTATGDSVTTQTSNATLVVNSPGFITVAEQTTPAASLNVNSTTPYSLTFKNTGGSKATVTVTLSPSSGLSISSGNAVTSFDVNAGSSVTQSWVLTMTSVNTQTLTVTVTSTANTPSGPAGSPYSITGSGTTTTTTPGGTGSPSTATSSTNAGTTTGGTTTVSTPTTGTPTTTPPAAVPPASAPLAPVVAVADISDASKVTKKVDYTPKIYTTSDGVQLTKAATYEEVKSSGGAAVPVYVFNVGVKNTTLTSMTNVNVRESIPKSVASNVSNVTFKDPPTKIIQADPVVEWLVPSLAAGEEKKFTYFVTQLADPAIAGTFQDYVKTLPQVGAEIVQQAVQQPPAPQVQQPKQEAGNNWVLAVGGVAGLVLIGIVVLAVLGGGYWFFLRRK